MNPLPSPFGHGHRAVMAVGRDSRSPRGGGTATAAEPVSRGNAGGAASRRLRGRPPSREGVPRSGGETLTGRPARRTTGGPAGSDEGCPDAALSSAPGPGSRRRRRHGRAVVRLVVAGPRDRGLRRRQSKARRRFLLGRNTGYVSPSHVRSPCRSRRSSATAAAGGAQPSFARPPRPPRRPAAGPVHGRPGPPLHYRLVAPRHGCLPSAQRGDRRVLSAPSSRRASMQPSAAPTSSPASSTAATAPGFSSKLHDVIESARR